MVKMNLGEVRTQTQQIKSYCQSLKEGAQNLNSVAFGVALDVGISGATGNSIKNYLSSMYPSLAQTMTMHAENLESANQDYVDGYVAMCGGKSLDSEVLQKQIDSYNTSIQNLEASKASQENWYQAQEAEVRLAIRIDYQESIRSLSASIASNETGRDKVKEKLEKLLEFNGKSSSYFSEAGASAGLMNEGLQLLGGNPSTGEIGAGSWNGHGFTPVKSDWKNRVNEKWDDRNAKIKAEEIMDKIDELQAKALDGKLDPKETAELIAILSKLNDTEKEALIEAMERYYYDLAKNPIVDILGFEYNAEEDYYYTNKHSIQSIGGFNDVYDKIGWIFGMDIDEEIVYFNANGKKYRFELWKGSYGFGNAYGAELGLYYKNPYGKEWDTKIQSFIPGWYACVEEQDQIRMKNTIYDKKTGEKLLVNDTGDYAEGGKHYWNLAIRTDGGYSKQDIITKSELEIPNAQMREQMVESLKKTKNIDKASIEVKGDTIKFIWKK